MAYVPGFLIKQCFIRYYFKWLCNHPSWNSCDGVVFGFRNLVWLHTREMAGMQQSAGRVWNCLTYKGGTLHAVHIRCFISFSFRESFGIQWQFLQVCASFPLVPWFHRPFSVNLNMKQLEDAHPLACSCCVICGASSLILSSRRHTGTPPGDYPLLPCSRPLSHSHSLLSKLFHF